MKPRRWLLAAVVPGAACQPPKTYLAVTAPKLHADAGRLSSVPGFIVVPARDRRPSVEYDGRGAEVGFIMASSGAAMSHASGAAVSDDDQLGWSPPAFAGQPASASMSVASDIGRTLAAAADRPIRFAVRSPEQVAASAEDGAVIVTVVIDHVTKISPRNAAFSQTKSRQGNYEVTTTETSSEMFGPFWTFTFQIELGEVHGHRITRRLVRHAAAASTSPKSYSDAIGQAAYQVVEAVATEWTTDRTEGTDHLSTTAKTPRSSPGRGSRGGGPAGHTR